MIGWRGAIPQDWVDYNGHLRDAFYLLIFSYAVDGLMDEIGLDAQSREHTGLTLFTLEAHINYLHEVKRGAVMEARIQIMAMDRKRLHLYLTLHPEGEAQVMAASEQMLLQVNLEGPKSAAFTEETKAALERIKATQQDWPAPEYTGRKIGLI
jgi:acyl-CoA thioester hydrolase